MKIGKLDNQKLNELILKKFKPSRAEVLGASAIGDDCSVLDLGQDLVVLSCDPITAAGLRDLGRLSVYVNCNDAAAAGAEPVGLLVTLLIPPTCTEADLAQVADDLAAAAREIGVDILGGHTEVTDSVTRMITVSTVVARKSRTAKTAKPKLGDALIMTKWAGLEGSAILAHDYPHLFSNLPQELLQECEATGQQLSILPEARIMSRLGISAMHDVTEGGVLGAAWELAWREGVGLCVDIDAIPILPCTKTLCKQVGIDPLRLIGSGSLLCFCADADALLAALHAQHIPAAIIGNVTENGFTDMQGNEIAPPGADAIYNLSAPQ